MNVQDTLHDGVTPTGNDPAVATLINAAAALLAARNRDIPEDFVAALFGLAVPEDVQRYAAGELATVAEESWAFLAERKAGEAKIRFDPSTAARGLFVLDIVNDDMPFLVDSVVGELNRRSLDIRLFVHPVFVVARDSAGRRLNINAAHKAGVRESFIQVHVAGADDAVQRTEIVDALASILADVRACVQDWQPMLARIRGLIGDLRTDPPLLSVDEIAEAVQFLEWMVDDNFTLLGARDYVFADNNESLEPDFKTGLGLLRSRDVRLLQRWNEPVRITSEIRAFLEQPTLLTVTKATIRSRVHRPVHLDYVGVKRFDHAGKLVGEHRFCGLFTSTAYTQPAHDIPYLRRKIADVVQRAGFDPSSHSGKALVNVLETYPRDELFQIDEETLFQFALTILQLEERPRVRVLPRRDRFDRFVSVLVYVPRDRYDGHIRAAIGDYLAAAFNGRVSAFYPYFTESALVRVYFIIGRSGGEKPDPDRASLDRGVEAIVRSWTDGLRDALAAGADPARGRGLFARYHEAFPIDYREVYSPAIAVGDIRVIETLAPERPLGVDFYRQGGTEPARVGLKVFSRGRPISLSERVPVLENMGFRVVDERTYHIRVADMAEVWFHDMELESASGRPIDLSMSETRLEACFIVVMSRGAESDGYNALVLETGLGWRDVALIRTFSHFLRQVRVPYSQDYMWTTLRKYPAIAAQVVTLFQVRFDPHLGVMENERASREAATAAGIESALQSVVSLDEDRILRRFVNAVRWAIRTNFYQLSRDGRVKDIIAIKFASRKLDEMPLPRPLYEVFVYSPRVEAIHLRFGKVARGGIRWSDRPQDFRTEILGLVKAQNVKNAVIVPVGAKGGFIPNHLSAGSSREAVQAEGVTTYKMFIWYKRRDPAARRGASRRRRSVSRRCR
jgi:glutamate dehydrogenase